MNTEINDKCPSCGWKSLFIGSGGHITCGNIVDCKYPILWDGIKAQIAKAVRAERIANQKHWIKQWQAEVDRMEAVDE